MEGCSSKVCSRKQSCSKEIGHPGKCNKDRKRDFYKSSPIYIEKGRTNKVNQLDDTINFLEEKKAKLSIDVHQKLEDIHRAVDEKKT